MDNLLVAIVRFTALGAQTCACLAFIWLWNSIKRNIASLVQIAGLLIIAMFMWNKKSNKTVGNSIIAEATRGNKINAEAATQVLEKPKRNKQRKKLEIFVFIQRRSCQIWISRQAIICLVKITKHTGAPYVTCTGMTIVITPALIYARSTHCMETIM